MYLYTIDIQICNTYTTICFSKNFKARRLISSPAIVTHSNCVRCDTFDAWSYWLFDNGFDGLFYFAIRTKRLISTRIVISHMFIWIFPFFYLPSSRSSINQLFLHYYVSLPSFRIFSMVNFHIAQIPSELNSLHCKLCLSHAIWTIFSWARINRHRGVRRQAVWKRFAEVRRVPYLRRSNVNATGLCACYLYDSRESASSYNDSPLSSYLRGNSQQEFLIFHRKNRA